MTIKTHTERKNCELRVRELADYMAASQQARITVLRGVKYRRIAQTLNHKEARLAIATWLKDGGCDKSQLKAKADYIRTKMTTGSFEAQQNDTNADYIEAFLNAFPQMQIPSCELYAPDANASIVLNGTKIVYNPDLIVRRTTKINTAKIGGIFLRYAKGKDLSEEAASTQSAFTFGFLKENPYELESKPENKLCMTIDGHSGKITEAPGDSVYRFKEMTAACALISAVWPTIQPPPNAVF